MRACVRGIMPIQSGKGGLDFPVYRGVSRQYGHGLGSIFKAALRTVAPISKQVAKIGLQSAKKVAKEHGIQALKKNCQWSKCQTCLETERKNSFEIFWTIHF